MGKIQCYKRNHDNLFQMKKLKLNMQLTPPNKLSCQSKFLGAYPQQIGHLRFDLSARNDCMPSKRK